MDKKKQKGPRTRDRAATEALLLAALERVLSRDGFRGLGVNAVAREAGVDKVLIYRYFGGLEGLVEAFGQRLELWLGKAASPTAAARGAGYGERIESLLREYVAALRANPSLQQILAWELVDSGPVMRKLDTARSVAVGKWMAQARGDASPPPDVDAPAVNVLMLAAMHYLVLRERSIGAFAGMDLSRPATWTRLERAAAALLAHAYRDPEPRTRGR